MEFPISEVRGKFPSLEITDNGQRRIYFDNAAGTQVPRQVIDAVTDVYLRYNSNIGVFNSTSVAVDAMLANTYEAVADFLGAKDPDEIIFGPTMTSLTFRVAQGLGRLFKPGDEIIVTQMCHEGNVSPWLQMAEDRGLKVNWLPFNKDSWRIEPENLAPLLNERTKLLALNYASNLTGAINDVADLIQVAKSAGSLVFVDGVQFAPHGFVDVEKLGCDFFACSPYKFFGPHLGLIWGRRELLEQIGSHKVRCSTDQLSEKFAQGTHQIELLAGLGGTIEYLEELGRSVGGDGGRRDLIEVAYQATEAHEARLSRTMLEGLAAIPEVTLHGPASTNVSGGRVPTFSFTHKTKKPSVIAKALSLEGIFCQWGHNYAFEVAKFLGLDLDEGAVRLGFAHYNTEHEVQDMLKCLRTVLA